MILPCFCRDIYNSESNKPFTNLEFSYEDSILMLFLIGAIFQHVYIYNDLIIFLLWYIS